MRWLMASASDRQERAAQPAAEPLPTILTFRFLDRFPAAMYLTNKLNTDDHMSPDHLSVTFAALADPTRRAILARLASGDTSVQELAEPFDISLPAISRHLKVLENAGLIARGREAQWRPCRLEPAPLKGIADWVERYRRFWEQNFDRLDDYLHQLQKKERKHGRNKR
jgi:DNA-binding transcriptional ArsR family regulator